MVNKISRKMQFMPVVLLFLFYTAGIIFGHFIHVPPIYWLFSSLLVLIFSFIFRKIQSSLILILFFLVGGLNITIHETHSHNHLVVQKFEKPVQISGKVIQTDIRKDRIEYTIDRIIASGKPIKGKILIKSEQLNKVYLYGDNLSFSAQIRYPTPPRNPGLFDYERYLEIKGIHGLVYLKSKDEINCISGNMFHPQRMAQQLRLSISDLIDNSLTGQANAILKGLIVGMRGEIDDEVRQQFVDSGIIHVLAVSGLHVGYITLIFLLIFGLLRFGRKPKTILTICALIFYAMMVDMKPSVVRAVIMASIILVGQTFERRINIYNSIAVAGFVQILFQPTLIFDAGFQLSFSAVLSIVYIYKKLEELIPESVGLFMRKNKLLNGLYQSLLVSFSATIGTLPITAYYFHRISIIGIVTNLVAIPLIGVITALGFALIIIGSIIPIVTVCYGELIEILVIILQKIISFLSSFSFSFVNVASVSILTIVTFYWFLILLLNCNLSKSRKLLTFSLLIFINYSIWQPILLPKPPIVTMLDVGQGDAILIEIPKGKTILIDTAARTFRKNFAKLVIEPVLIAKGIKIIDYLILTHPHNDHIGGAPYLLHNFKVNQILEPKITANSRVFHEYHKIADSLRIPIHFAESGQIIQCGQNELLYIFYPSQKILDIGISNFNNASIVCQLICGETELLFTGDAETEVEEYLAFWGNRLESDILKVGHHGSPTSSSEHFIKQVKPDLGIISVGKGNKFRHPSQMVIDRYSDNSVEIHRTDLNGACEIDIHRSGYKKSSAIEKLE